MYSETIHARGHANITSKHKTTFMATKDEHATLRGDCIIAVSAGKACADLPAEMKDALRRADAKVEVVITCDGLTEKVTARGHPNLALTHTTDMVVRKSNFTCSRTLAVSADKASSDFDRKLVKALAAGKEVLIKIKVYSPDA